MWSAHHIAWLLLLTIGITALYEVGHIAFHIPWLPVSVIGTAVAFYVGFKNNQAYDRMWEARKIWGGIVNASRTWGMMVDGFVSKHHQAKESREDTSDDLKSIKQRLVYRHIGWMYAHRRQLLQPTSWEHISQGGGVARWADINQRRLGVGLVQEESEQVNLGDFIPKEEIDDLMNAKNTATQIINAQSRDLQRLYEKGMIDDFRHMEMANLLKEFYTLQGKNERIKKFPLPRQYANLSRYFVGIFILLLPFSMIPELISIGSWGVWLAAPITALIGWVYVMMEVTGDYTENPFQGMANDIPMLSLCRTIEIDLREMLRETDLPPAIEAKRGVLM